MARVTHVKKAQQRYATVPVLDDNGQPKRIPVKDKRTGEQKVTKRGRPVFMNVTQADKTQPLPNRTCEACKVEIKVGDPYKHVTPKSGPYGGTTRFRCATCPVWQPWDLSNSLSARTAQIEHDLDNALDGCESIEDVNSALEDAASEIESLAEEKEESASNIEDGFGHETQASEELREVAESLTEWAETVRNAADNLDDFEEETDCEECEGTGEVNCTDCGGKGEVEGEDMDESDVSQTCEPCEGSGTVDCTECGGSGQVENDFAEWWSEARSNLSIECTV